MKKTFGSIAAVLLLTSAFASAEESTIIDFTLLTGDSEDGQNSRTTMDYSVAAGATFTDEQKALMKTSLALPNWEVEFNSSAQNTDTLAASVVRAAPVRADASVPFAGSEVMGVRIVFPPAAVNANAKIVPPFAIPAYQPLEGAEGNVNSTNSTTFEGGYGVVKNVGVVKSLSVTTMGMNRPEALYVLLSDVDGVQRRYFMGYLNFDGWRELTWNNPDYISDIRAREIRVYPIYPRGLPFVKFDGFQIVRDATQGGNSWNDFIGYFKDVRIIYDKAVLESDRDIADEDLWGIITTKETAKQEAEMQRFGAKLVDRYVEREKQATEENFTSSLTNDGGAAAQQQQQEVAPEVQQ